jgi:hypothetical protein
MTPGIPGAGIGGLFYVLSSIVLSLRHGWRRIRRQQPVARSHDVALLAALAAGIGCGVWLAGWLVGLLVTPMFTDPSRASTTALFNGHVVVRNAIRVAALIVGVATLAFVMLGVELARLWQRTTPAQIGGDR